MMRRLGLVLLVLCCALSAAHARKVKVKLATVAPKGTAFHRILEELAAEWEKASGGDVELKIFPGGVAGDETEVIRKIRLGTLSAGLVTSTGLAEIDRAVNALQIPMAFASPEQFDFVREKMEPGLEKLYADKGFVILGWSEAGWVRFLSTAPIVDPADAHKLKMFINGGNAEQVEVWKKGGFKPVPLPVTEITTALQTGLIEAVPTTPQGTLMMQWHKYAKYMSDFAWSPLVGGLVIDAKTWEKIDEGQRAALLAAARRAGDKLRAEVRANDRTAVEEMVKRGLVLTPMTPEALAKWRVMVEGMRDALRGAYVPPAAWDEAQGHIAAWQAGAR
ncbi:MAG: TRAP transporter substrate-binding protein DctP [Myxococcales bacterium]|nr:TRAP transporter substrate-binding protein DctP [Myxococcales bacterium]MCB9553031.1 TRAP transporter substrate-binding protein DctP [Myxococcales bacterium]